MLKKIWIREKTLPVLVPIHNLQEAIAWISSVHMEEGSVLTKIRLDGVDLSFGDERIEKGILLSEQSVLSLQIDSPQELSVKTLDVIQNLSAGIQDQIKTVSEIGKVPRSKKDFFDQILLIAEDIQLTLHMITHVQGLVVYTEAETRPVSGVCEPLVRVRERLLYAHKKTDAKECMILLLHRLVPLLATLQNESKNLQIQIFSALVGNAHSLPIGF